MVSELNRLLDSTLKGQPTMLRRLGNKTKLLPKLLPLFPENITTFIDMFMGSGAVTFAMVDRAKYIIANDNDEEVFNLFMTVKEHKEELEEAIRMMPIHDKLFQYWKKQEEYDCVWKATRFLMLSNFSFQGAGSSMRVDASCNSKYFIIQNVSSLFQQIQNIQFICDDFRKVVSKVHFVSERDKLKAFLYADKPYDGTDNNYAGEWKNEDTQDLFDILVSSGLRFAVSEFKGSFSEELSKEYGLLVTEIGERRNLKNRATEILITNYEPVRRQVSLFDLNMN
jgi:DNA adenine methylase